eukprot:3527802-Rhodomonas_salina.2
MMQCKHIPISLSLARLLARHRHTTKRKRDLEVAVEKAAGVEAGDTRGHVHEVLQELLLCTRPRHP